MRRTGHPQQPPCPVAIGWTPPSPEGAAVPDAADGPRACVLDAPVPLPAALSSPTYNSAESDAALAASRENVSRSDRNTSPGTARAPARPPPAARAWDWAGPPAGPTIRHTHAPDSANANAASADHSCQ